MPWNASWEREGREITGGCANPGCFAGIAMGCTTDKPKSLVPRLGGMDLDFPLHSRSKQTGKKFKLTKLGMVPWAAAVSHPPGKGFARDCPVS